MITYTVRYRVPGHRLWRKLKNVTGDGFVGDKRLRFIALSDETMVYIPDSCEVEFSPERAVLIERKLSKDAGQPIQRAAI